MRVNKHRVAVAPASLAGLVLACVSITACRHAATAGTADSAMTFTMTYQ